MFKKRKYTFGILLISCLLIFTGCSVTKNVKNKEVKEFTKSLLESNEKVKELKFYLRRPGLYADLAYDGDLDEKEMQYLIDEFKTLINIEFMNRIGDEYKKGSRPIDFGLYIHIDKIRDDRYDYLVTSRYHKEPIVNDDPDNIDGYETWSIIDNKEFVK